MCAKKHLLLTDDSRAQFAALPSIWDPAGR
jgi:hypothetical protein